jgi:hypothetical protein
MNLSKFNAFSKEGLVEEGKTFFSATLLSLMVFGSVYAYDAYAANPETETLTVTIAETVTFAVSTDVFGTLTPLTYKIATSTLSVDTNANSWNIQLYGTDRVTGNTTLDLDADGNVGITDQQEWTATSTLATTTAPFYQAAVVRASLGNSGRVLAFRVMTASGTVAFRASTWWGATDADGTALWAGIASTSANARIGKSSIYSASNYLNTVQYYLDVPVTQQQGAYQGDVVYTWATGA